MKIWSVLSSFIMVHIDMKANFATIACLISFYDRKNGNYEMIQTHRKVSPEFALEYCKRHNIKLEVKHIAPRIDMLQGVKE